MLSKMKRFLATLLVLVLSIGMFIMPAQAVDKTPTVEIPVSLELSGTLPQTADVFRIQLKADKASYPMPEGAADGVYTLPFTGAGSDSFRITFNALGVYTYTIRQTTGSIKNCYLDTSVYEMTISVTNAPDGGYETNVAIYLQGVKDPTKQDSVTFKNRYANPVKVTLSAIKTVNNRTPDDNAFSFTLVRADGSVAQTVKNKGQSVDFAPLLYDTEGTYVYKMSEVIGNKSNMIYDKSVYTVTVLVEKDDNGDYQAKVSYQKADKDYEGTPRFANKTKSVTPSTGDMFRLYLWVGIMAVSFVAIVILLALRLRKKK